MTFHFHLVSRKNEWNSTSIPRYVVSWLIVLEIASCLTYLYLIFMLSFVLLSPLILSFPIFYPLHKQSYSSVILVTCITRQEPNSSHDSDIDYPNWGTFWTSQPVKANTELLSQDMPRPLPSTAFNVTIHYLSQLLQNLVRANLAALYIYIYI